MLIIDFHTEEPDILIAMLYDFPFEGFQELDGRVEGYLPDSDWHELRSSILAAVDGVARVGEVRVLAEKNWNAEWEAAFQPVELDDFCRIRASFHPALPGFQYEIVIDPKMAFGTGHHETTASMIRLMQDAPVAGSRVLDLGCGTGILGILAAKQGAMAVLCVDNDPEAVSNTTENAELNQVPIDAQLGTSLDLLGNTYDVVLANINRNVLLEIMGDLSNLLKPGGTLLLSGYLENDLELIHGATESAGFIHDRRVQEGEWCAEVFHTPGA